MILSLSLFDHPVVTSPPTGGVSLSSLAGARYYDVQVTGISDGAANICITNANVNSLTVMQYWTSSGWVDASPQSVSGTPPNAQTCGSVPLSAFTGTNFALGVPTQTSTVTTTQSTTFTTSVLLPTTSSLTCNTNGLGSNLGNLANDPNHKQTIHCQYLVSASDQGVLQGKAVWSSSDASGTFANEQCEQTGPNNQVTCQADYAAGSSTNTKITISASYGGDGSHSSSTGSYSFFLGTQSNSQAVAVSLACSSAFVNIGDQMSCTATVTAANGVAPTGSVAFSSSDSGTFSHVSCNSINHDAPNGDLVCAAKYSPASSGENTITASYSGDGSHTTGSGSFTVFAQDPSSFLGRNAQEILVLGGSTLIAASPIVLLGMKSGAKRSAKSRS